MYNSVLCWLVVRVAPFSASLAPISFLGAPPASNSSTAGWAPFNFGPPANDARRTDRRPGRCRRGECQTRAVGAHPFSTQSVLPFRLSLPTEAATGHSTALWLRLPPQWRCRQTRLIRRLEPTHPQNSQYPPAPCLPSSTLRPASLCSSRLTKAEQSGQSSHQRNARALRYSCQTSLALEPRRTYLEKRYW